MQKHLRDLNHEDQIRLFAVEGQPRLQRAIPDDLSGPADAQRVAMTRDHEDQPDLGMREQILKCVEAIVPQAIRDC